MALLQHHDSERPTLERFIAERYATAYGARVTQFARHLVGMRSATGAWSAGLGYTPATSGRLFVEHYLDRPIEEAIGAHVGIAVRRDQVVEVGNLAAASAGAARRVIVYMTGLLHELHHTWVVFTSTRVLLNSFVRLGIPTIPIAPADRLRLPDGGRSWGTYYETNPRVIAANIPLGYARLRTKEGV